MGNTQHHQLSNFAPDGVCIAGDIAGRIVSADSNARANLPTGFRIEPADGTASFINVDQDKFKNASRLAQGWVADGLLRMVQTGKKVELGVQCCGAAERVIMLDRITAR